ncbi:MAG: hypothetical protein EWM72_03411 [Nitrospira sp.]|nr:MAG: hypothetical protein EWM72_03411 [Nitrospira sp.]
MADERESMSPTKIGLGVLWPACWTGLPIKLAFAVLALAMGLMQFEGRLGLAFLMLLASPVTIFALPIVTMGLESHLGEGIGIPLLFLISIPIDIWALGVVGRTFFLEKLRKEPPDGLGLTLWWKSALVGALFLPILWLIVSTVTSAAISMAHSLMEMEMFKDIPVAERISIELTLWGSVASAVLIVLLLVGVSLAGRMIRRAAEAAQPASETYQGLITRWDLMRVPADQGLMLTALTGAGVVLSLLFWAALPVTTPHPHECCEKPEVKAQPPFKPVDALNKNEQRMAQLSAQLEALEQQKAQADAKKDKGRGKAQGGKDTAPSGVKKL